MTTQSIIVYRNPAEAMLWESGMVWPLMVACFISIIVFLVTYKIGEMVAKPRYGRNHTAMMITWAAAASAVISSILTLKYMGTV